MMKEVVPFAASLSCVLRVSRRLATKMKVANGHQPGNGRRTDQIIHAKKHAEIVTKTTKK
jgi:hypothetical protein